MNRIDRVVTFRPLGETELQQILDIELEAVRQRVIRATGFELGGVHARRRCRERCCCAKGRTAAMAPGI